MGAKSHIIHISHVKILINSENILHNKLQIKTLYPVSTKPINTKTYIGNKLTINNERSVFVEHIRLPVFLKRIYIVQHSKYNNKLKHIYLKGGTLVHTLGVQQYTMYKMTSLMLSKNSC